MFDHKRIFAVVLVAAMVYLLGSSIRDSSQALTTSETTAIDDLPFVKNIDFDSMAGRWYEIASKPNIIEKKCTCAQSVDTFYRPTTFHLSESCVVFGKNITSNSTIVADAPGLGNFTNHNGPLSAPYWVIDMDYLYRWMVIGQPSRKGYWIQSRTKTLDKDLVDLINKKWATYGFNLSDL